MNDDNTKSTREIIDCGFTPADDEDGFGTTAPPQNTGFAWLRFNQKDAAGKYLPVRFRLGDVPIRFAKHNGKDENKFCLAQEVVKVCMTDGTKKWQMQPTGDPCPLCEKTREGKTGKTVQNFPAMVMLARGLERKGATSVPVKIELKPSMREKLELLDQMEGDLRGYDLVAVMQADGKGYELMKVGDKTPLSDHERGLLNELGEDWSPVSFVDAMITKFKEEIANGTTAK